MQTSVIVTSHRDSLRQSVRLYVRHIPLFCPDELIYDRTVFSIGRKIILSVVSVERLSGYSQEITPANALKTSAPIASKNLTNNRP